MKQKANNRKQCLAILVLTMLILTLSGTGLMTTAVRTEAAQKKTGFIKKNGSWYYYDSNGFLSKGCIKHLQVICIILEKPVQQRPESCPFPERNTASMRRVKC